ncbi:hypothetical protein B9Q03_12600 [Candidatus Marsarchaeota G2 archaeon OSP_D]|uniref:Uncharacterized protein n=1 Tax=Candidatus Marsarchaeota G2 archaeon OSP_D TaxID=1978157 RepID=A0A2R6AF93_9ARCH|nr:MAG: hypothetical protein B9Q03_12600 [Candidatus Marsarchaeota G2 archaeon OSP_D]
MLFTRVNRKVRRQVVPAERRSAHRTRKRSLLITFGALPLCRSFPFRKGEKKEAFAVRVFRVHEPLKKRLFPFSVQSYMRAEKPPAAPRALFPVPQAELGAAAQAE